MQPAPTIPILTLSVFLAGSAAAGWPTDPAVNVPVCVAPGNQGPPRAVSDGSNGIIVAWRDNRAGAQVYAQRVDASGTPKWAVDGIPISASVAGDPMIVADGSGGAVIVWIEVSGPTQSFRAQRLSPSGLELWSAGGVTLRSRTDVIGDPQYERWYWDMETGASDGAGGLFLCFRERHEEHSGVFLSSYSTTVLVLHCDANAAVAEDRVLASDSYTCSFCGDGFFHLEEFSHLRITPNTGSGSIVAYRARPIVNHGTQFLPPEIRVIDPTAGWSATVVTAVADVRRPQVAPDLSGGAIVSWEDTRSTRPKLYANRVSATGTLQWGSSGLPVCVASGDQFGQEMASDGGGGVVLAWLDWRNGGAPDVFAQRLDGAAVPQWGAEGVALCTQPTAELDLALTGFSDGSAAVAWRDTRSGAVDLYARFVGPLGNLYGSVDGDPVTTAAGEQTSPSIVSTGTQATLAWRDSRGADPDVYAQRIGYQGPVSGLDEVPSTELTLARIAPNPSRGVTSVRFLLPRDGSATLWVSDLRGTIVRALGAGARPAGEHVVTWDGRDDRGREVGSGIYFLSLDTLGRRLVRRLAIVR